MNLPKGKVENAIDDDVVVYANGIESSQPCILIIYTQQGRKELGAGHAWIHSNPVVVCRLADEEKRTQEMAHVFFHEAVDEFWYSQVLYLWANLLPYHDIRYAQSPSQRVK